MEPGDFSVVLLLGAVEFSEYKKHRTGHIIQTLMHKASDRA